MNSSGDSRVVTSALIQTSALPLKEDNIEKAIELIREASSQGAQIICLPEMFYCQYFAALRDAPSDWKDLAEPIPGPLTIRMQEVAASCSAVLVTPMLEKEKEDFFNTAVVFDADGSMLGKYRKAHLPQIGGFWEQDYFSAGDQGYPVFKTAYADIGVFLDFDRHYPEVPRILALNGAEILFNPCTTVMDLSHHIWFIAQRAHAALNNVFVGSINRVGREPYTSGTYYGMSYFSDPKGEILAQGSQDMDEIVIAQLELSRIKQERERWDFFSGRRTETYGGLL